MFIEKFLNNGIPYLRLVERIDLLLEFISSKFDTDKFRLSFGLITSTISSDNSPKCNYIIKDIDFAKEYIKLYKKANELGFVMDDYFYFDGFCSSKSNNSLIISPSKKIFKCLSFVGRDDFAIDSLAIDKEPTNENYFFPELYEECFKKECPIIPMCQGGCRFDAYLKNGTINSIDCKLDATKEVNKLILEYIYDK